LAPSPALLWAEAEGLPAGAAQDNTIIALGRLSDTAPSSGRGYGILQIDDWTIDKNYAWVLALEQQGLTVRTVSSITPDQLWRDTIPTVFALELAQLAALGYQRVGNWLVPPGPEQRRGAVGADSAFFRLQATIPDGVDPGVWLADYFETAFGSNPDAGNAWPGLRTDVWGALGREQVEQLGDVLAAAREAASGVVPNTGWAVWSRGSVRWARQRQVDASHGWSADRSSLSVGAGTSAGDWQLALTFDRGSMDVSGRDGASLTADGRTSHLAAAGRAPAGPFRLELAAAWGTMAWDGARHLRIASLGNPRWTALTAAAKPRGRGVAMSAGLTWPLAVDALALEPWVGMRHARSSVHPFSESGGAELSVGVSPSVVDETTAALGIDAVLRHWVSPRLRLDWRHGFDPPAPALASTFLESPGEGLSESTATAGRDRLGVVAGITVRPSRVPRLALEVRYALQRAHRYHAGSLWVATRWDF
jgi:outer membrane autotransporter protein